MNTLVDIRGIKDEVEGYLKSAQSSKSKTTDKTLGKIEAYKKVLSYLGTIISSNEEEVKNLEKFLKDKLLNKVYPDYCNVENMIADFLEIETAFASKQDAGLVDKAKIFCETYEVGDIDSPDFRVFIYYRDDTRVVLNVQVE